LPDIREVPQPALRDDEPGIDPDMSAQSPMVEGERRGVFGTAGFDLDEREGATASRDDVDFPAGNTRGGRGFSSRAAADTSRRVSRLLHRL